jgi:maltooligosyltrehalose trehalohydrolase
MGLCDFVLWAPKSTSVALELSENGAVRMVPMNLEQDYWQLQAHDVMPGSLYRYCLDGREFRPDPASAFQPQGVHGPSMVIDQGAYRWNDEGWKGYGLSELIIYELHVGTFTPQGTFEGVAQKLDYLQKLGITAIELMPVSQFPGERNWGYDGTYPFAPQNSYGGVTGLKGLVDAAHQRGIAVILDMVYNHFGPEGNYTERFAPYFTTKYTTPWGKALNFDDAYSDHVRSYFVANALFMLQHYHLDGLRLDAVHAIVDMSAKHILTQLAEALEQFNQRQSVARLLIAESDLNNPRIIRPRRDNGYGIDAQWCDDFHHALHVLMTGERNGINMDFGRGEDFVKAYEEGFVYDWRYSSYRKRFHGSSSANIPAAQMVVFSQNHDQVGNRMSGERLGALVDFEGQKLVAGLVLSAPYIPLLFMGEEYGENAPFLYFVSHGDAHLVEAVRRGRLEEFADYGWAGQPPDPQSPQTFERSKLDWDLRLMGTHATLHSYYCALLLLRRSLVALRQLAHGQRECSFDSTQRLLTIHRHHPEQTLLIIANFSTEPATIVNSFTQQSIHLLFDSSSPRWQGGGSTLPASLQAGAQTIVAAHAFAIYADTPLVAINATLGGP